MITRGGLAHRLLLRITCALAIYLAAASSQESYGHAIDEFIAWYRSEPRLAFNRTVVLRYRFFLEQKNLAPSTINVRLAAVRRLAFESRVVKLLDEAPTFRFHRNRLR